MKTKILGILCLCTLALISFTSCSNDDDLPDVSFDIEFDDAVIKDGILYVHQNSTFEIESVKVINNDPEKAVTLTGVSYYWDYEFLGANGVKPYGFEVTVGPKVPTGEHFLEMYTEVLAVDKSPAQALITYRVVVLPADEDLPGDVDSDIQAPGFTTSKAK